MTLSGTPNPVFLLAERISEHFSSSELDELCHHFDIEPDELPGDTRSERAFELVDYLRRRNRLTELVDQLHKERPHVEFD
jgi:hypothetical protein